PLPGQSVAAPQNPRHQPCSTRQSCCACNRSVRRNLPARDGSNFGFNSQTQLPRAFGSLIFFRAPPLRFLHSEIHPKRISHSDPTETNSHKNIPNTSGRCPTCLTVATEIPLPIKNSVAVSPIFASFTISP